jgi:hypothetical protein
MSKADPIESALQAVGALRHAGSPDQAESELRKYLGNRSNLVVAKAAKVAGELRVSSTVPQLVAAFERLMKDPAKLDKRCAALTEIVVALYELDYTEPEVYLRGLHHVQMEPSFGEPVDAAAALRGISAQGLLRTRYPQALAETLPLLLDPEPPARVGAVRAFGSNGGDAGLLLLRFKVLTGDAEPEVLGECFSALLTSDGGLAFVTPLIEHENAEIGEAAIWALGQSRLATAFAVLEEKWGRTADRALRKVLAAAMAASRLPEAIEFLCSQLRDASVSAANDVLDALAPYAASATTTEAVRSAVEARGQKPLIETFQQQFRNR